MGDEARQKLYHGDAHGAVESVLVETGAVSPTGNRDTSKALVTVWLRLTGRLPSFECAATEAAVIAQRLITPVKTAVEVVPAPGDRCGGGGKLPDGSKCPGCRACA